MLQKVVGSPNEEAEKEERGVGEYSKEGVCDDQEEQARAYSDR